MTSLTACHECDLMIEMPEQISRGSIASCPRCNHTLAINHDNAIDHVLALSSAALIMLILAVSFSFLGFDADGQVRSISLLEASFELFNSGFLSLAALVLVLIVILPAFYFILLIYLTGFKKITKHAQPPALIGHAIAIMLPWLMADVFIIGVMVALIKLVGMATVFFGVSFWAYIAFTILYLKVSKIVDSHQLWEWLEPVEPAEAFEPLTRAAKEQ